MNIPFMKAVDRLIGRLLTLLLPLPTKSNGPVSLQSILIIRPGGIGDAVLLAPLITSIKHSCPAIHITILAERRNAGSFALIPEVDRLYCYDKSADFWQAVRNRYDVVIDTEQWHRLSAVVARLIRAPVTIGFDTNERRRMFTHAMRYSHDDYELLSFLRLLEPLGNFQQEAYAQPPFLTVPAAAAEKADQLLEPLAGKSFVVLFPGASIPERRWGGERFKAVAERLVELGYGIVVVGGEDDRQDGKLIAVAGALNCAGKTSLAETAAVIARSSLLVSGDSGVLHLAVGLGVPTVSLFGPGRASKWAPQGEDHSVLNKQLSCSRCTTFGTTPPCPHAARCMQEITVAEVIACCEKQLQKGMHRMDNQGDDRGRSSLC